MKAYILRNKLLLGIILILSIVSITLFAQKQELYFDHKYESIVPHIELMPGMLFFGVDGYNGKVLTSPKRGDIAYGSITGFVKFPNSKDQPRGLWQYNRIEATETYDENGNQQFLLIDIMKMPAVAPRYFDPEILKVVSNSAQTVTLESESGNLYKIEKLTDKVTLIDSGDDVAFLITSDREYRDFMLEFLY